MQGESHGGGCCHAPRRSGAPPACGRASGPGAEPDGPGCDTRAERRYPSDSNVIACPLAPPRAPAAVCRGR
ncbi:hypothetical protein A176_004690 [Myxococcus hansupus]|uniref:Uncharacterized protein n=1 Tax=Pseudomyxococcus hansupus TaxID=1297742 RepID=A0A0H4X1P4_9BACT|nr:hypothetical protein A176_004690 [Myxococcus hansupus]